MGLWKENLDKMPFTQLFYHLVWSTKNRQRLLTPEVEPIIHTYLRMKASGLGAIIFALNGWVDHVHIVVTVPPKIAVATFVGQIKAVASTKFNQTYPDLPQFYWQAEYGAFTFDGKRLPNYIKYVEHQKEHHAQDSAIPILERVTCKNNILHERGTSYGITDTEWRCELETSPPGDQSPG